jgi:peptidoglycan hydrolase-like protein with peptidoglycan-binding domain
MRQPLRNTAVVALVGFSALASANALYKQHHHPAPLFGSFADAPAAAPVKKIAPVMPAARPPRLDTPAPETTGSVNEPAVTPGPQTITSSDVTQMQQKLASLGLFNGAADGLFGPKTAKAIKAFEASIGKPPRGLLTPAIIAMIEQAPMPAPIAPAPQTAMPKPALPVPPQTMPEGQIGPAQAVAPAAAASQAPVAQALPPVQTQPQAQSALPQVASIAPLKPLPAPAPLDPLHPLSRQGQPPVSGSAAASTDAPASADMISVGTSTDAGDAGSATETVPMNKLPPLPKRVVPTIAVHVQQPPAETAAVAPQESAPQAAPDAPAAASQNATDTMASAAQTTPAALSPAADSADASTDPKVVAQVQRGLNSLGFLHQQVDGVAGEATAKAIRNFEVYFNYNVTGRVTRQLVNLLEQNGAVI